MIKKFPKWILNKNFYITIDEYNIIVKKRKKSKKTKKYYYLDFAYTGTICSALDIVNKNKEKNDILNKKILSELKKFKIHFKDGKLILS